MSRILPKLRAGLDIFPSPDPERPGIVMRDSMCYSEATLLIPPVWVLGLPCFDGQQTELDMQALLTRRTGEIPPTEGIQSFVAALQGQGFLETEEYYAMRDARHAEFRASPVRPPVFTASYTAEMVEGFVPRGAGDAARDGDARPGGVTGPRGETGSAAAATGPAPVGIAAPHVSPEGGHKSYAEAYRRITPDLADRTFIILGTSHYGEPEKFGVTRKPYQTPLGESEVDHAMLDKLVKRAPGAIVEEDYCHAVEHSIEFQVLFLQHVMGRPVKVLPILCGAFFDSLRTGHAPESTFFDALGDLAAEHGKRLFWILGIDMAHMGVRYGDNFEAIADHGQMAAVAVRDKARLNRVCAGDAAGFAAQVTPNGDDLKWCGYSPLYTFMRAVPEVSGRLLSYEQWNIDPQSVVSFGALEF